MMREEPPSPTLREGSAPEASSPAPLADTLIAPENSARAEGGEGDPRASLRAQIVTLVAPPLEPGPERIPPSGTLEGPPSASELPQLRVDEMGRKDADLSVVRLLGQGGMGKVVLATQRSLRRRVALKTTHLQNTDALLHEGAITGMLEHPNIPPIHALSRDDDGRAVLVMKNIEGVTWTSVLRDRQHPLRAESPLFASRDELAANLEILCQLTNALELAHEKGVIHRDIKPDNVMLGRYGEVYLIDWGIAFHEAWATTDARAAVVGTPVYMAPEMLRGSPDPRSDVYLLGATLHEVLTGNPPHIAASVQLALAHAMESPPPRYDESVPAELASICARAMARDPAERFESVRALRAALRAFLGHRASISLCAEADERASTLRSTLAEGHPDPHVLATLEHECRFAFRQALREWPENRAARDGLSEVCRALARHEIARGNPERARVLLAELSAPDVALLEAVEALERAQKERADAEAHRIALEREMDLRNAHKERMRLTLVGVAGVVSLMVYRWVHPPLESDLASRHASLLYVWFGVFVLWMIGLVTVGRGLFLHRVNRHYLTMGFVTVAGITLNRVAGCLLLPGAAVTLTGDMAILSSVLLLFSRLVIREITWIVLVPFASVPVIALLPHHAGPIFNVAMLLTAAHGTWLLVRAQRRAAN